MTHTATLAWLAHHELRLAWRDWWSMLTAGKPRRARIVAFAMLGFAAVMHFIAFSIVARFATIDPDADRATLVVITGCVVLAWSLMMSQAMESVTRAFYARSDLDLILSSPIAGRKVFAVRIATMAASIMFMSVLLAAPFINILIYRGGVRWLTAYGVVIAVGAVAATPSAKLMLARVDHVPETGPDARTPGFLYLYTSDLEALRARLLEAGHEADELEDGPGPGPTRQMCVRDPDGHGHMVAELFEGSVGRDPTRR